MAVTTTAGLSNTVVTAYDREYLENFRNRRIFFDMVDWQEPVGGDLRGMTVSSPVYEELEEATATLTEGTDVTPVAMEDDAISLTLAEYGNAVANSNLAELMSFSNMTAARAAAVGQNQARSLDKVIRGVLLGGTLTLLPNAAARSGLDTTNDLATYAFFNWLYSQAQSMDIPTFDDDSYAAVIHPALMPDIKDIVEKVGEYADPAMIYTGNPGVLSGGGRFKGEWGRIANIRLIPHAYGKLYLGEGAAGSISTTLGAAPSAGDTTITVASASGMSAGDWLTIDATAATAEQVQIVSISGTTITIRGRGNGINNFGLQYAHSSGVAVTDAANAAAIPVFGPNSLRGRFATDPGKNGRASIVEMNTYIPKRIYSHSWYWVGGFAIVPKWVIRGEVATSGYVLGGS